MILRALVPVRDRVLVLVLVLGAATVNGFEVVDCLSPGHGCDCGPSGPSNGSSSVIDCSSPDYLCTCGAGGSLTRRCYGAAAVNRSGAFDCSSPGYNCTCAGTGSRAQRTCADIDECEENICGNGTCQNIIGSFWCDCTSGFTNYGSEGKPCAEIPEVGVSVSEGEWEPRSRGGVFVLMGGDFNVTCSMDFPLLGGFFQLTSPTLTLNQSAINNSAHFLFTDAGAAHKGDYTCVYVLQEFNLNITSSGSLHIRPGEPVAAFLLRALILSLLMLLNFIPYVYYKRKFTRLSEATRGRQRSRRAAAEPGADAVSEMM